MTIRTGGDLSNPEVVPWDQFYLTLTGLITLPGFALYAYSKC